MDDLISRQDAKDALVEYARFLWDRFHEHCNLAGMLDAIDNVPPAREKNGEEEDG